MKSTDLFTRPAANAGQSVEIPGPDGVGTSEYLTLHHIDCDAFRKKRAEVLAAAALLPQDTPHDERRRLRDRMQLELIASLVSGWTLEDEFSQAGLLALLENAPYLADWIDRTSEKSALFFGKGSTS